MLWKILLYVVLAIAIYTFLKVSSVKIGRGPLLDFRTRLAIALIAPFFLMLLFVFLFVIFVIVIVFLILMFIASLLFGRKMKFRKIRF